MSVTLNRLAVQADLTVSVSRHAPGDLQTGVRRQVERIDGVTVESIDVAGLQPGLNDLTVEARAELRVDQLADRTREAVADRLESGFGVSPSTVRLLGDGPPE